MKICFKSFKNLLIYTKNWMKSFKKSILIHVHHEESVSSLSKRIYLFTIKNQFEFLQKINLLTINSSSSCVVVSQPTYCKYLIFIYYFTIVLAQELLHMFMHLIIVSSKYFIGCKYFNLSMFKQSEQK